MHFSEQIRSLFFPCAEGVRRGRGAVGTGKKLLLLGGFALAFLPSGRAQTTSTYSITSVSPASIPAGAAGATLGLSGTLPDFTQNAYQVCFYTGSGSSAALTPTAVGGVQTITVPASVIQSIDPSTFTAANGYAFPALVSVVPAGQTCDGTFDATLTNSFPVPVVEPTLGAYTGPTSLPQANSAAGVQGAPIAITLSGANFVTGTTVTFGSFGRVTPRTIIPTALTVLVPAAFASSDPNTTASLSVCNGSDASGYFCSTPTTPITLTVNALAQSSGTITATPSPVLTSGQTTLTSTFKQSGYSTNPVGSPSGTVTFVADGQTLAAAKLILDKTAGFTPVTSSLTIPMAATPVIAPASGTYVNSTIANITDATAGAAIYFTTDGSMPTTGSTLYTGPFSITTSETITAIAALSGALNSAAASAAYTITISPPTKLAFQTQPVTTATSTAITPAVQVAVEDADGSVVTSFNGQVTVALSANPGSSTLAGTLTVSAVSGIATFSDLAIGNVATGYVLRATSGDLTSATSNAFDITPNPITVTVQSELVGIGSTLNGTFTLGHPAPAGGLTVTLASSATANVTIAPATVTVAVGHTTGSFTYTGVAAGDSNLTASATNYQTGTTTVTGTAAQVSLGTIPTVAPGQTVSLALSLPMAAPPGGTMVTFTSSDTGIATVTSSVFVPAGASTAATNPQIIGVKIGTTTIVASAPGFRSVSLAVSVTVVSQFNPGSTSINLATTTSTTLNISAPAQAGGLTFTLTSDNPAVATVPTTISMVQGTTSVQVPITGLANGTTTIRADSAGVAEATMSVTVNSNIVIGNSNYSAYHLQSYIDLYLPVTPQSPTTVTVSMPDTTVARISSTATAVGTTSVTFNSITSSYIGRIYTQGVAVGTTTLTIAAPGYTTGSGTLTIYPAGFSFYPYSSSFPTTTYASPTSVRVAAVVLQASTSLPTMLNILTYNLTLAPGVAPVSVPVSNSTPTVGALGLSTYIFNPGDASAASDFTPKAAGSTTLTIGTPTGNFSTPSQSQYQQITATVTSPQIVVGQTQTGENVQTYYDLYLPATPPSGVTVTVTIAAPAVAVVSKDVATAGTNTLSFTNVTSTYIGRLWLQGYAHGSTTLTISAPGYLDGSNTVTVEKTGFSFYPYNYSNFTTTTFSSPTSVRVSTVLLDPTSSNIIGYGYQLNPGLTVTVPLTNSTNATGTIASSVVLHGGDTSQATNFTPVGAGTSTIAIGTTPPAGFTAPSQTQYQSIVATVTAPTISVSNITVGVNLQDYITIYVPQAPPTATTMTVTINGPSLATLSKSNTVAGSTTQTFSITDAGYVYVYVQGQSPGTTTVTASATGYTSGSGTVTVGKSGFSFYGGSGNFTTTTFSGMNQISLRTEVLDPTSLNIVTYGLGLNPGVSVAVPLTDSSPQVGTIGTNLLVFNPGEGIESTTFQPVSAGMATLTIGTPAGFSTPSQSQYLQIVATVTAPQLSVSTITTGLNLQGGINVYVPVTPPGPVDVVVTSNGPAIATLSGSATTVGGTVLTFPGVTSAGYVGTIFVQGQKVGSTTITASAAGYSNGIGTATVYPAGFSFYGGTGDFSTTSTSGPTTITVSTAILNLGTLTIENYGYQLNPGIGAITVPVTSASPTVGTIGANKVVFNAGDSYAQTTFTPLSTGSSMLTIGTPSNVNGAPNGFSTPSQYTTITASVQ